MSTLAKTVVTLSAAASLLSASMLTPALAQRGKLPLVRDAETEALLRDYAKPIFAAAGVPNAQVDIILVNDKGFNAFVPDARRMFINLGVILDAQTPGEVIGVIAHETGHIAGNHLARLREAYSRAQIITVIGALLGAGAIAAGSSSGSGSIAQGGAGAITAGAGFGQRTLLSYQRGEEASADRAALTYLERTGQSAQGMLKTFSRFADQALFSAQYVDPYALSHPLPRDRFNGLETLARKSKYFDTPAPTALQARHDLVRAKLLAFTSHPSAVERAYPRSDNSLPAQYARAVVASQSRQGAKAAKLIDGLLQQQPNNPYFYELKGQALLESGKPRDAIAPFRKAVAIKPNDGQLLIWLGFALVASNDTSLLPEAESVLKTGLQIDSNSPIGFSQLAIAASRQGKGAEADLATAQGLMARGDLEGAKRYAKRAKINLKTGSRGWLQADDILSYIPPKLAR